MADLLSRQCNDFDLVICMVGSAAQPTAGGPLGSALGHTILFLGVGLRHDGEAIAPTGGAPRGRVEEGGPPDPRRRDLGQQSRGPDCAHGDAWAAFPDQSRHVRGKLHHIAQAGAPFPGHLACSAVR